MDNTNIIVIGASAGGFEVIKRLMASLPANLNAAVFIVWHMSADVTGIMPQVLNRQHTLLATHAVDKEPIRPGHIYVAPPDWHLLLEKDRIRVTRGPKENGFRPAVDPLFRSAAYHFGPRVIAIILSGALDDGSAGLWTVKHYGGIAIVQDPLEAEVSSMPAHAIREVAVDYILPVGKMAAVLLELTAQPIRAFTPNGLEDRKITEREIGIALQDEAAQTKIMQFGELTQYTCPECHGVLSAIREDERVRYRCHTGHAFSADSLLKIISANIENSLWNTIRAMEESIILLNHMGDHFAEVNRPRMAAQYFKKANEAMNRTKLIREALLSHETLSYERIEDEF